FVVWGGFRGALSVALALSVTGRPGIDAKVPILAYGVVVLSLLFQGSTIRPLARWLSRQAPSP
ncbi:MAG: cation:proton antiporter, partial [Candidatus Dormibacteraeota bacterium]|nr:cation:proton antiporter [Candidatus Dormibacteraeota bacterium]